MKKIMLFLLLLVITPFAYAAEVTPETTNLENLDTDYQSYGDVLENNQEFSNEDAIAAVFANENIDSEQLMKNVSIFAIILVLLSIGSYVYLSFAVMHTAKRLGHKDGALAWIPIVGKPLVLSNLAKMHWWPILLLAVGWIRYVGNIASMVFAVFMLIWLWKVCEARSRPGWWALIPVGFSVVGTIFIVFTLVAPQSMVLPTIGVLCYLAGFVWSYVLYGILAWGK